MQRERTDGSGDEGHIEATSRTLLMLIDWSEYRRACDTKNST